MRFIGGVVAHVNTDVARNSTGDSLVLLRRHRPRERKHKTKPRGFRRMTVRAVEHCSAAQNQLDRRPRVFARRNRVHVEGNKPTLQNGVDFTTTAFQGATDKAADVFRIVAFLLRHTEVLLLGLLRPGHTAELINELRPEHFFSFPACRTPRATRRNRYQAVVLKSRH